MNKKTIEVICALLLLISITFITGKDFTVNSAVYPTKLKAEEKIKISSPVKSPDEFLTVLTNSLNKICAKLILSINNTNKWFSEEFMYESIDKALQKSSISSPYYSGFKCKYTTYNRKSIALDIDFDYKFPRETLLQYINKVEIKAVDIINSLITSEMTDFQKEKVLHDYIVNHTRYDTSRIIADESYTPYGVLINGVGVCEGYAQTMNLLLNKAGVACIMITGTAKGEEHAWNIVKIGGEYYHLDATWDDPVNNNQLTYNYYNLNDEMISITHRWDQKSYPPCHATEYNYFKVNGLLVQDFNECKQRIQKAISKKQGALSIKILEFEKSAFLKNLESLLTKLTAIRKCTYSFDEDTGVLEIKFYYSK